MCGDIRDRLKDIVGSKSDCISFEESKKNFTVDLEWVNEVVNGRACIFGNLDAVNILQNGTEKKLESEIKRQITIGKEHGMEDVFVIPDLDGIQEYRMKKEVYYGRIFNMKEGWNAGYDTRENIGFIGAFPVDQPEFMHMYMNHPLNPASHYYYVEFQPWIHITRKNKMYFSYYMWASAERWENGLKEMRERNLISQTKK